MRTSWMKETRRIELYFVMMWACTPISRPAHTQQECRHYQQRHLGRKAAPWARRGSETPRSCCRSRGVMKLAWQQTLRTINTPGRVWTFSYSLDDVRFVRSASNFIVLQILPSNVHMPVPRLLVPVSEAVSPLARCCEVCRVLLYVALAAAESAAWIQLYNSNHL